MAETEVHKRTCRVCGESFSYPEHKSRATRSYCEKCVDVPEDMQRVFASMRRRIDRLEKDVASLKQT